MNTNNEFYQNAMINARKDNDEWINAAGTCNVASGDAPSPAPTPGISGKKDVNFYDYDGTIVASYTTDEFADLSALPENPTHEGLTAQGWNWSLSDAKTYVATYGKLEIGQMYITDDGKTRLYFIVTNDALTSTLTLTLGDDTELDIDWGDNSTHTAWTSNDGDESKSHTYATAGRYVIAISVVAGSFTIVNVPITAYKIEVGNGAAFIGDYTFREFTLLSTITLPNSITQINPGTFNGCYALKSVTIPNSVTSIGDTAFAESYSLSSISIPNTVTSISAVAFADCYSLSSISIPDSVTSIGQSAFNYCKALAYVIIPDSVTNVATNVFSGCSVLVSVAISSSLTSIEEDTFSSCYKLSSVTIPNSVTNIHRFAFTDCYSLSSIVFESSTPPTLSGELSIPYTCIIRVPQGSLLTYTSAANYPDPSEYVYEEY